MFQAEVLKARLVVMCKSSDLVKLHQEILKSRWQNGEGRDEDRKGRGDRRREEKVTVEMFVLSSFGIQLQIGKKASF